MGHQPAICRRVSLLNGRCPRSRAAGFAALTWEPRSIAALFRVRPGEGVLKAQVADDSLFAGAWPHADRNRDTGNNLEPALEVMGPTDAGADEDVLAARGLAWRYN